MIYFTSDQHFFFRKKQNRVGNRLFDTPEDKNDFLVSRWNERVEERDTVYILGDFSHGNGRETNGILNRLKGKKHLIIGNNDKYLEDPEFHVDHFFGVQHYCELLEMDSKWVLFHFPLEAWSGYARDGTLALLPRSSACYKPGVPSACCGGI